MTTIFAGKVQEKQGMAFYGALIASPPAFRQTSFPVPTCWDEFGPVLHLARL